MYCHLQINDHRAKGTGDPKVHAFWVKQTDIPVITALLKDVDFGRRKRRRSRKHHRARTYLDKPKGNVFYLDRFNPYAHLETASIDDIKAVI
jgi:hypothetical protein